MSVPPTVADMEAELTERIGRSVADVGLYLDGPGGTTPTFLAGLRLGLDAVGVARTMPLGIGDADVANLSPFAAARVLDEAEAHALKLVLRNWYRAMQGEHAPAVAPAADTAGGWLAEERRGIKERLAELKADLDTPYREPSTPNPVAQRTTMIPFAPDSRYPRLYPEWGCD